MCNTKVDWPAIASQTDTNANHYTTKSLYNNIQLLSNALKTFLNRLVRPISPELLQVSPWPIPKSNFAELMRQYFLQSLK